MIYFGENYFINRFLCCSKTANLRLRISSSSTVLVKLTKGFDFSSALPGSALTFVLELTEIEELLLAPAFRLLKVDTVTSQFAVISDGFDDKSCVTGLSTVFSDDTLTFGLAPVFWYDANSA